ncbi:hypothetical protein [Roseateles sp.]|uniref:hypothetical protein n=1 Tax=Roseateles sp. TaxID=1971397 RepID=UPI0031D83F61
MTLIASPVAPKIAPTIAPSPAPAAPDFRPTHGVNAELLLSTPLTVVVRARLDFIAPDGLADEQELALVIPRSRCEGDQPYWPALLSAATEHWHRCPGHARRMLTCVDGEWKTLLTAQPGH